MSEVKTPSSICDDLKLRIKTLDNIKNAYVAKKLKGETDEKEEKKMAADMIYIISELRNYAASIGVNTVTGEIGVRSDIMKDGETEEEKQLRYKFDFENLKHANDVVKNLREQILIINKNDKEQLYEVLKSHYVKHEEEVKVKNQRGEEARKKEVVDRLRKRLPK